MVADCWISDKLITIIHNAALTGKHNSQCSREEQAAVVRVRDRYFQGKYDAWFRTAPRKAVNLKDYSYLFTSSIRP